MLESGQSCEGRTGGKAYSTIGLVPSHTTCTPWTTVAAGSANAEVAEGSEFARRHHDRFSSVFWLDGRSEDTLKRSIASCAGRIPHGQIAETSRMYAADSGADVDVVMKDVLAWLARPDNTAWLLIFDNVDREHKIQGGDPDAYDVTRYLSGADHGSVPVTTRLARLEQLGKVSKEQAQAILESWYKKKHGKLRQLVPRCRLRKLTRDL
jgi:hypothetical protein